MKFTHKNMEIESSVSLMKDLQMFVIFEENLKILKKHKADQAQGNWKSRYHSTPEKAI